MDDKIIKQLAEKKWEKVYIKNVKKAMPDFPEDIFPFMKIVFVYGV